MKYRSLFFVSIAILLAGTCAGFFAIKKLGGWRYTAHRLHTLEAWPTYTQRLSQLKLLPIQSGDVVFIGDSHIAFGEWQEWFPDLPVANRGIPGEGIKGLQAFAKTLDLSKASTIVVQIGTNDLLFHKPEVVISYYRELVAQLDAQTNSQMLYCTLPGINNEVRWTGIDEHDVDLLNDFVLSLGKSKHKVLNLARSLKTKGGVLPKGLTDDGVHLRGDGYYQWKQEIDHYLNRVDRHL